MDDLDESSSEPLGPYRPLADEPALPDTPMWLSHHWPVDYDRCALLAGRHVCRRCVFMYPVAAVAALLLNAGRFWPSRVDVTVLWLLPLPAVVDFVTDNLRLTRYSPRRQAVLTALGAIGAAAGYVRYLASPGDAAVWTVVVVYGLVCVVAAIAGARMRAVPG